MIRQPKKKVYGAVIGAAVQVGKAMSEAGVSAIEERQQRMMEEAEASGYKDLDTNSLANKEALKNAIEWNPIKKIQSATANKDMSTSGKVASVAGSMGLGAVSGIANLFNKDLSAGEKAASFIPFVGGAMANRAAARKMKDRMVNQAEFAKQSEEGAKKMEWDMSQMNVAKKTFKKGGIVKPKKYIVGGGKADNVSITNKADLEKKQLGEQEANNLNSQTINVPEGKVEEFMNSPEYRGEIVQPIPDKMETIPEAKAIAAAPETPEAPAADAGGGMAGMAGGIGGAVASIFTDKRKMTQFGLTEEQLSDKSHKKMAKGGVVKYAGKNKLVGKVKSTDEDVYKVGNNDYGKIKFKTTPTPTPAISTSSQPTKPAILSDNTVKIASIPTPTSVSSNGVAPKTNSADLINRTTPKSTPSTVTKASQADIDSLEKRVRAKRSSAENKAVNAGRAWLNDEEPAATSTPWYKNTRNLSNAAGMAASILPGIINVATAYKNKPKQYNASDYENKNFGRAFDEMSRPELLDISAELSNNRSSAYEMYQNMASVANGQNAGFIAKNLSKVHRAKFNADAQTYQKKQNFDAAIKNEFKAKRSQMLLDDGKSNAANRYQVDRDNEAEKAGNLQMKMEGFSQIGKGVADSLKNWTKSNNDSEVLGRLKEILSAKKGGVVGHKFISGGVSSKINPNKLIEVQKGEVMYNPNNESIVTAKQLAKTKGIPERTHNQKGYDPAQRKDVTGIQIPTPERGTIIYGNMKNPISGNKFQDDAQKLAKLYANYAKKLADPKSDALERRTARLNAQNSIKNFKELANIQETLRSLKSPKKGK